ncbi:MAG TPA: 30S ribosomal protein S13 [Candidatus Thermoplasmatota archaeon]|nr:30S ribosomal protein S13 [Candidatus Thermoplasmatota archaeon]
MKNKSEFGQDFRFLVRLHNTDLDGKKPVAVALSYVPGVSHRLARIVTTNAKVDPMKLMGNLSDPEIAAVASAIEALKDTVPVWMRNRQNDYESGEDLHLVGTDITIMLREDLNRLKKIRSWRGHRHEKRLPTRGQRTKANGRFGSAVGVQRKEAPGAAPKAEAKK